MADATIRLDQPEIVDTDARLDAESRVVAALTVLLERVRITGAGERYMDVNAASEGLVHDADLLAKLDDVLIELNTKLDAGGEVALDAATLLALETIVVSGTVALDVATLTALENVVVSGSVAVSNFPASQPVTGPLTDAELRTTPVPVSGTVTANLGTIDGAATETTLLALEGKVPDEEGTWGYYGGASGTVIVGAGERVIGIAAVATAGGATLVINGGDSIPIPTDIGVDLAPRANLVAPTIVFSGTASFVVEVLN